MGQLLRLIIILFGLWLVFHIAKRAFSAPRTKKNSPQPGIAKMVVCAHCGVHIPEPQALRDGDMVYCSEEHRNISRT